MYRNRNRRRFGIWWYIEVHVWLRSVVVVRRERILNISSQQQIQRMQIGRNRRQRRAETDNLIIIIQYLKIIFKYYADVIVRIYIIILLFETLNGLCFNLQCFLQQPLEVIRNTSTRICYLLLLWYLGSNPRTLQTALTSPLQTGQVFSCPVFCIVRLCS